ncbi:multi-sensor signal transduction multi-kinase [Nitzschia inconspicua]|uniref:Multi-sensor signal transduction multi-kinase n=1 Tax=Nitzschia inconspicua TaxID=303405 RepID=A0A9K3M440_9STRA|nr:multi-sensor signal transduction multi-kinase [Nitzschia inconspicua]
MDLREDRSPSDEPQEVNQRMSPPSLCFSHQQESDRFSPCALASTNCAAVVADNEGDSNKLSKHHPHPASLRYDEQLSEAHYDLRHSAHDDVEKTKLHFPQQVLFGRDAEITALQELYSSCCRGQQEEEHKDDTLIRIALLEGPSGVGKSRLVQHAVLRSDDNNNNKNHTSTATATACSWIAAGKFNQNLTIHPFSAIVQSLEDLVAGILVLQEEELSEQKTFSWTESLRQSLQSVNWFDSQHADVLASFCKSLGALWKSLQSDDGLAKEKEEGGGRIVTHHDLKTCFNYKASSCSRSDDISLHKTTKSKSSYQGNITQLATALSRFFHLLASPQRPLIWFIDDLHWADSCSILLLEQMLLLSNQQQKNESYSMQNVMFVGAFLPMPSSSLVFSTVNQRPNDPPFRVLLTKLKAANVDNNPLHTSTNSTAIRRILNIQVSNLKPKVILEVVRATLDDMCQEDAWPLTNALYSATLGNILHVQLAMEHLVRTNQLYYDVMLFSWQYKFRKETNKPGCTAMLEDVVSPDVLTLVHWKMKTCSPSMQALLIRAAYTTNTYFSALLLLDLMHFTGYGNLTANEFRALLDQATEEGFLLNATWELPGEDCTDMEHKYYQFSHDKVKEAARNLILEFPPAKQDQLVLSIATVLIQWAIKISSSPSLAVESDKDWLWFVAVHLFNSLPVETIFRTLQLQPDLSSEMSPSRTALAEWNYEVADLSLKKGSFSEAIRFLNCALKYLPEEERWINNDYYDMTLQIHNKLMELQFAQGNYDGTKDAIALILAKSRSLKDKVTAYYTRIKLSVESNDCATAFGVTESLSVLQLYGLKLPLHPTSTELFAEKAKFAVAMQNRSINALSELRTIDCGDGPHDDIMKLLSQLSYLCGMAQNHALNEIVALRAMQYTLEHGLSVDLALILTNYSIPLRIKGRYLAACRYSTLVKRIFERFSTTCEFGVRRNSDFLLAEFILHAGILPLKDHPYAESLEKFVDITHQALAQGETETAFMSAILFPLSYFASGTPITALLEPKLTLFEAKAKELLQPGFAAVLFCSKQVLLALKGGRCETSEFEKQEEMILEKLEAKTRTMALRDFSIYRLFLACIFGDSVQMAQMMDRLQAYPHFDMPLARQYMRLTFGGIAAFLLARSTGKKHYRTTGKQILREMKKLDISQDNSGSINVRPIILCLTAVDRHKMQDYVHAIKSCREHGLLHLEGLMNELCGLCCLEQDPFVSENDWSMKSQHVFWARRCGATKIGERQGK